LVYAPAEVPPRPQTQEPPARAEASAAAAGPAAAPAPVEAPASAEPEGAAGPSSAAGAADLAGAAGLAEAAGLAGAAHAAGQAAMPSPISLEPAWHDEAAPPGPAPVEQGFGDQGPVHSPTSLDVSWRDQAAPPGPAPVDQGFGEPGAPFGAGQPMGEPYGQAAYPYDAGPAAPQAADSNFGGDFVSLPLLGGQAFEEMPRRDPLPMGAEPLGDQALSPAEGLPPVVMGIYCKNGHFDDPEARYCAVCGIGMAQLTKVSQEGRRPPLGVLILDDGSVCQLDTDYVVGREPTLDKSVAEGRARPLRLGGAPDLVSRIHARVELDGWQVFVTDLNSANGTILVLPGETTGTKLTPGVRTPLVAGAQIRLGDAYALRYDSHRHR